MEWFFSARQLCELIGQVHNLPAQHRDPDVADVRQWASVVFKGGSEPGLLNLTTQVTARTGTTYCVSATWNRAAPLDEGQFEALYSSLLQGLAG